jgi:hypothetical protein
VFAAATSESWGTLATIMKKILQIILYLITIEAFACDCTSPYLPEKFVRADFVANVTIIKVYPNKKNESGYKADIKIDKLFKGEKLKSIYISGRSDRTLGSSCDIFIPENTKLIVYATKNKEGNYGIGMCSGYVYLNSKNIHYEKRELEILKKLKSKKKNKYSESIYREKGTLFNSLEQFKGIKLDKSFALFEIIFDSENRIQKINLISGFGNSIDKKLTEILRNTEWRKIQNVRDVENNMNNRFLFCIYYYEAERGNQSFLSQIAV